MTHLHARLAACPQRRHMKSVKGLRRVDISRHERIQQASWTWITASTAIISLEFLYDGYHTVFGPSECEDDYLATAADVIEVHYQMVPWILGTSSYIPSLDDG